MEVHEIDLHPGGTYRLNIGGLGSAGYAWSCDPLVPSGIVTVAIEPLPLLPVSGTPPNSYSVQHVLTVTAISEGVATIHLSLKRPWEASKPPLREIRITASVAP